MAPPPTPDSVVSPCFCGCLAFLHRHFPPQFRSSHPLDPSFWSQQQPSLWDCSTVTKPLLPAAEPSRGPVPLWGRYGCRKAESQFPFRLPEISHSVAPPTEGRSSPTDTPVFPPSSFVLLSFSWFYIFFSTGQVLLSALPSWCSAHSSLSEGVFLMYLWREMYSMSTFSSTILLSP